MTEIIISLEALSDISGKDIKLSKYDEVVTRCKDCKWYDMTDSSGTVEPIGYRCKKVNRLWREPDDFCSWAERRNDETD